MKKFGVTFSSLVERLLYHDEKPDIGNALLGALIFNERFFAFLQTPRRRLLKQARVLLRSLSSRGQIVDAEELCQLIDESVRVQIYVCIINIGACAQIYFYGKGRNNIIARHDVAFRGRREIWNWRVAIDPRCGRGDER